MRVVANFEQALVAGFLVVDLAAQKNRAVNRRRGGRDGGAGRCRGCRDAWRRRARSGAAGGIAAPAGARRPADRAAACEPRRGLPADGNARHALSSDAGAGVANVACGESLQRRCAAGSGRRGRDALPQGVAVLRAPGAAARAAGHDRKKHHCARMRTDSRPTKE